MARIRFDGQWYSLGDDDSNAQMLHAGMKDAMRAGQPVSIVVATESAIGSTTLFWTPGVAVTFETDFPLTSSAKRAR